ncbi:hypothetical protein AK88_01936 [Plasmodium fragile]|uniref:Schizont-infected cell agglutination C-terminal domain-containing protein n=1 Tax=Plasmodium fragile TaxID=5857 RepID=A0A0D9QML2_PLAFR|nr:uncharacterized protein AK88_01936 [Plasmodium fragile]KJP88320.1 hypothetical protein AK88_01936 [Plasmodium fragile]
MGTVDLAHALADWLIAAGIYDQNQYEEMVWNKTKEIMEEFVQYMETAEIISYATPCGNAGWQLPSDPTDQAYVGQTVGDKIVCVLMVGALLFMNGWHTAKHSRPQEDATNASIRQHLLCAIVHMFSAVLNESVCKSQWGTFYAWKIMDELAGEGGFLGGSIKKGTCGRNIFSDVQIRELDLNTDVKAWLGQNSKLKEAIQKIKGNTLCTDRWGTGWSLDEILGHGNIDDSPRSPIAQIMHGLQHPMTEVFKGLKQQVEERIEQRQQAKTGKSATDGKNGQAAKNPATASPQAPPGTKPAEAGGGDKNGHKPSSTSPSGAAGTSPGSGRSDPAPAPQPPPAAPEPPSGKSGGAEAGATEDHGATGVAGAPASTDTSGEDQCNASLGQGPQSSGSIVISTGCTPDADLGGGPHVPDARANGTDDTKTGPTQVAAGPQELPEGKKDDPKDGTSESAEPAAGSEPQPGPLPSSTPDTGHQPGSDGVPQGPTSSGEQKPDTQDGHDHSEPGVNVQNDRDPFGGADFCKVDAKRAGVGGKCTTLDDGAEVVHVPDEIPLWGIGALSPKKYEDFTLDPNPRELHIKDAAGGFVPPVPADGKVSSSGDTSRDYAVPDLTDTVLTATTPVLFFLSALIVALLGYSLWQYFAHLGQKRRRTFRTVRDVPSPPLDKEILDHLQRGELPPPDYGYTMIRDTQPGRLPAARRRRHPRVHTRTIIDLHLEVLHECDATAWENVKDDYLQILVEEFAQECAHDMIRDANSNNNILGLLTSDYGSGNAVTDRTTCDTVTDIPTCYTVTHIPTRDDPKPDITHQLVTDDTVTDTPPHEPPKPAIIHPHTNAPVTDTHTCDHPQPEITDITTSHTTTWLRWIDRNKHLFQACTGQTWFNEIKSEWKQYLREHMVANANNGVSGHRELGEAPTPPMKKLDLWKEWIARQHKRTDTYSEEEWFQHLLNNVQQETATPTGEVSVVDNDLEVDKVTAAADMLRVTAIPCTQPLHQPPHMKQPLTATLWMLLLASVIEESELERSLQDRELYVDDLLEQL